MTPLTIVPNNTDSEFGIGGNAPVIGVELSPELAYFFSIPNPYVEGELISVFTTIDFDKFWENRGRIISNCEAAAVFSHKKIGKRADNINASILSRHSLREEQKEEDFNCEDQCWSHHKLGGFSYLEVSGKIDSESMLHIKNKKLQFVAQISFPDHDDDSVSGSWPVGDGTISVYADPENKNYSVVWA